MANAQQFFNALAGFGAGVQGQGPQFLAGLREQQRMSALAQLAPQLQSGQITPQQYLAQMASIDPAIGAKLALSQVGVDAPADVKSWQFRNSLPEDQRGQFDAYRRNQQVIDLGGSYGVVGPGGSVVPIADKTLKPSELPETKAAQAKAVLGAELENKPAVEKAVSEARLEAEATGSMNKKSMQATNTLDLVDQARAILPKASSGKLAALGAAAKGLVGMSDESTKANQQLAVIGAGLVANVPRMEGPQSDADVKMYKAAAGNVANPDIPYEDRLAALQAIEAIQKKYIPRTPDPIPPMDDSGTWGGDLPSSLPPATSSPQPIKPPREAVDLLMSNPESLKAFFDEEYGPGAADRVLEALNGR